MNPKVQPTAEEAIGCLRLYDAATALKNTELATMRRGAHTKTELNRVTSKEPLANAMQVSKPKAPSPNPELS